MKPRPGASGQGGGAQVTHGTEDDQDYDDGYALGRRHGFRRGYVVGMVVTSVISAAFWIWGR